MNLEYEIISIEYEPADDVCYEFIKIHFMDKSNKYRYAFAFRKTEDVWHYVALYRWNPLKEMYYIDRYKPKKSKSNVEQIALDMLQDVLESEKSYT